MRIISRNFFWCVKSQPRTQQNVQESQDQESFFYNFQVGRKNLKIKSVEPIINCDINHPIVTKVNSPYGRIFFTGYHGKVDDYVDNSIFENKLLALNYFLDFKLENYRTDSVTNFMERFYIALVIGASHNNCTPWNDSDNQNQFFNNYFDSKLLNIFNCKNQLTADGQKFVLDCFMKIPVTNLEGRYKYDPIKLLNNNCETIIDSNYNRMFGPGEIGFIAQYDNLNQINQVIFKYMQDLSRMLNNASHLMNDQQNMALAYIASIIIFVARVVKSGVFRVNDDFLASLLLSKMLDTYEFEQTILENPSGFCEKVLDAIGLSPLMHSDMFDDEFDWSEVNIMSLLQVLNAQIQSVINGQKLFLDIQTAPSHYYNQASPSNERKSSATNSEEYLEFQKVCCFLPGLTDSDYFSNKEQYDRQVLILKAEVFFRVNICVNDLPNDDNKPYQQQSYQFDSEISSLENDNN